MVSKHEDQGHWAARIDPGKGSVKLMNLRPLALLFFGLFTGALLQAQEFDLANSHSPVLTLDGLWRFHTGDAPAWSSATFDDSDWELLRSDENWAEQGHAGYSGIAWYRFKVDLPAGINKVSLSLPYILTSYQVYANGHLIGSYGTMPPHAVPYWGGGWFHSYQLPPAVGNQRTVEIAIRVWHWPGWSDDFGGGPSEGGALIGDQDTIERRESISSRAHHWDLSSTMILALLQTLAAIGALSLFLLRRSEKEYLWFGLMMFVSAAVGWFTLSFAFNVWNVLVSGPLQDSLSMVGVSIAEAGFYVYLLKGRRTLLLKIAVACILLILLYVGVQSYSVLDPTFQTGMSANAAGLLETVLQLPLDLWILSLLFTRARDNSLDARLLLAPVALQVLAQLFQGAAIITYNLGLQDTLGYNIVLVYYPFHIELLQVVDALFLLGVLAILIYRFTRTLNQEQKYEAEFAAARSVQQLLIPVDRPETPGLIVESEYLPAREVGGDFFQVIPYKSDGSALIVIGDVAGKGLQAAMLVAHIAGVLLNEASHSSDPERILSALNSCLCERNHAMATCIALCIARSGSVVLANAGHLPPYLNSAELPMESALPLGAIAGMEFPVLRFQLDEGDSLTFMTDGIAEAQDARGNLFGFEQVEKMMRSRVTALELASAAQAFGQEDDITVLTVSRVSTQRPLLN
jgi:sigma-B regulation protein RsbU (phosphoserine phosphatase)